MTSHVLARPAAACGMVFAITLTAANGDGSHPFNSARSVAAIAAITLALPFLAYLCSLLSEAAGAPRWLASTALVAGVSGLALKLASSAPELAMHRADVADGTALHKAIDGLAGATTVLSLYPLALFCAATAIIALGSHAFPTWLGIGAAVTAVALVVNGVFVNTDAVPALLLFTVWTLLTSLHLMLRTRVANAPATHDHAIA